MGVRTGGGAVAPRRQQVLFLILFGALVCLNVGVVAARGAAGVSVWPPLAALLLVNLGGAAWAHFSIVRPLAREAATRARAAAAARRHAHEVEDLVNRCPCGYLSLDPYGLVLQVNDTALGWLGLRREEVTGRPFEELVTSAGRESFRARFAALRAQGSVPDEELYLLRRGGSGSVLLRCIAVLDAGTGAWVCRCAFLDVTDRQRSEERLAEVSTRLHAVLSGATEVAIIAYDLDGRVTVFNSGAERMLGYRADEMVGREGPWGLHLAGEIHAQGERLGREFGRPVRGFDVLVERVRQGSHEEREWTFVRKDGGQRTVNLVMTGMHDVEGALVGFLGIATDVTERNRVRESLELTMSAARVATWDWDLVANRMTRSENTAALLGLPAAATDLSVEGVLAHVVADDREAVREAIDATLRDPAREDRHQTEFRVKGADGQVLWFEDRGRVFRDDAGRPLRITGTLMDVTERRDAAEQLRAARDAAEQANQAKTTFLASVAHEIRTPLGGIVGLIELLSQTPLSAEQQTYVEALVTSGEAMLSLINDVLDISKIEAGKLTLERVPFDPGQITQDAARVLSGQAVRKGLTLEVDLAPDLPPRVEGDPTRLRQVLLNLIGNAVKFTPVGGVQVRVRVGAATPATLEFEVADTGIGIPADRLQAIFDPFEQGDSATVRAYGGTGLGLSIAARLIRRMGGAVSVTSEVGKGSRFTFSIPLDPVQAEPEAGAGSPEPVDDSAVAIGEPAQPPPQGCILIAEDNIVNQQVLLLRLEKAGFQVKIASNGREAVEQFELGRVDLILMDLQMPEVDGLRATRLIRAREKATGARVPIVAVTANAVEGERQRCLAAGMDDYLRKPVRSKDLFATIGRLLRRPAVAVATSGDSNSGVLFAPRPGSDRPGWLDSLQSMNFGDEAISRLVQTFVMTVPERLAALKKAGETTDAGQIAQLSHALKGALVVFGARPAGEAAQQLEILARDGQLSEVGERVAQLTRLVEPLLGSMQDFLQSIDRHA